MDSPSASYIVVVKPWSVEASIKRSARDYNKIATWVAYILWDASKRKFVPTIECVYRMRSRDEVIVQLPLKTNIAPLLGQHNWADFVNGWNDPSGIQRATLVFEYNWRNNGDPANHNWEEFFPDTLPLETVPIKSPYPPPSWAKVPVTLTSFVLAISRPPTPPPQFVPPSLLAPLKREEIEANETKPMGEKPPFSSSPHYPLSIEFKQVEKLKVHRKHDPYEMEKDAEQALKNDPVNAVKLERNGTPDYQPSTELLAAFSSLNDDMLLSGSILSHPEQPPSRRLKREHTEESITSTKRVKLEDS